VRRRIVGAGIRRVVFPIRDPNPRVSGSGAAYLRAHGVDVTEGIGEEQARRQNAVFLTWITRLRPYVIVKAAVSSDGFVGRSDTRVKLTGAVADRYLQRQRAEVEAIAVGSGTVLTDDPWLTARGAYRYRPLTRIIFDWGGQVPPSARVFSTLDAAGHVIVSAQAAAMNPVPLVSLERRGVLIDRREDRMLAPPQVARRSRCRLLLVEGGPTPAGIRERGPRRSRAAHRDAADDGDASASCWARTITSSGLRRRRRRCWARTCWSNSMFTESLRLPDASHAWIPRARDAACGSTPRWARASRRRQHRRERCVPHGGRLRCHGFAADISSETVRVTLAIARRASRSTSNGRFARTRA
jgi:riboflavin biosynthesis pyrimidine reductase